MLRTPLYLKHAELGARLVEFAGYEMPLHYQGGINEEHLAVRTGAGVFDVSHMAEVRVAGPDATAFLAYATLNDPARLKVGRGQYSMLPNDSGGVIDDLFVYREGEDEYLIVANAANRHAVVSHLEGLAAGRDVAVSDETDDWALIAVQGPSAAILLDRLVAPDLTEVKRNATVLAQVSGVPVTLSRTGYTGEDGFEVFVRPTDAEAVWDVIVAAGAVPCGLGARDTLRLEAGYPLYGHELTEATNPLCTDFAWVVKDKPFYGREAMWGRDCPRRLVGIRMVDRAIPRQGYRVLDRDRNAVGEVSSGTLSPLTRESIGFAWVDAAHVEPGTRLWVEVRGRPMAAVVVKPPFHEA
ncbi:MAG TPA: glycine cleavage system aminomethyltransferase GcvT [Trueperaceae bacterium]|nr:glycine cleavage system aminomethyltransferase GcvT [Trueperaceae bacterium]